MPTGQENPVGASPGRRSYEAVARVGTPSMPALRRAAPSDRLSKEGTDTGNALGTE